MTNWTGMGASYCFGWIDVLHVVVSLVADDKHLCFTFHGALPSVFLSFCPSLLVPPEPLLHM